MIRQLEEDQCLSSCTWKVNPFFKVQPEGDSVHYAAKWWEPEYTNENTFPQLLDAPLVPEDLRCLEGCFDKYIDDLDLLPKIQEKCSAIGLDRQVPTHTKEGYVLVQSSYTDLVNGQPPFLKTAPLPSNPNLDCLVYYETEERKGCRSEKGGVCNFIPAQTGGKVRSFGTQRLHKDIVTDITDITDYRPYLLRASDPVTRAIEVCALAKTIQVHLISDFKESSFTTPEAANLFSGDSPSTCDHFLPDIFGSLCSCVGTCAPRSYDPTNEADPNLILHFQTHKGLWGCQDACKQTKYCEFYTHSKISLSEGQDKYVDIPGHPVFHCSLWKKCDNFFIPVQRYEWLDLRSGPKDCAPYTQMCPIVWDKKKLTDLPPGYTAIPCSEITDDEICEIEVKYIYLNASTSYFRALNFMQDSKHTELYLLDQFMNFLILLQGLNSSPWMPIMKKSGRRKGGKKKRGKGGKKQKTHKKHKRRKRARKIKRKGRVLGSKATTLSQKNLNR